MAGMKHETGSRLPDALGTVTNVFVPGSVVKAATLTAGWENGVISESSLVDQPISFSGSAQSSWFWIWKPKSMPRPALEYSSSHLWCRLLLNDVGPTYQPNMTLRTDQLDPAMERPRSTFASYGLGTETGIDLRTNRRATFPKVYYWQLPNRRFGRFDANTPMQLAQYVATLLTMETCSSTLVQDLWKRQGNGPLEKEIATKNNQVKQPENLAIIKQRFYQVVCGTSGLAAGKTIGEGAW